MPTALTADGRDKLARHLLGDTATAFPGSGQCYLSLHSAQPGNSGTSQISAGRTQISLSYDSGNKWYTNASQISVPNTSGTIQWYALWSSPGTGNVWFEAQLGSPVVISGAHSVLIPANSLRIYATPPDASNKGGIADKGAELVLGHFLGVSSWTMPTSYGLRCHSAAATRTGNANLSFTGVSVGKSLTYDAGNRFRGNGYYAPGTSGLTRYWSTTDGAGNAICYGECVSGETAWANYLGDSFSTNNVDFSGSPDDDSASSGGHTFSYSSMRVSFDIVAQPANGDVNSGTMTSSLLVTGTLVPSILATLSAASLTLTGLISVGSTSVAVGSAMLTLNAQIGQSAPGVGLAVESVLYESKVTLQTI